MFSLQLLGGARLLADEIAIRGPATQRHRLALMAILAAAHPDGVTRDRLIALLWPDRDAGHARNLLKQAVHAIRYVVGDGAILTAGDDLTLNAALIRADLIDFRRVVTEGDYGRAVELCRGRFLDGFYLKGAAEFEHWVDREQDRIAMARAAAVESLAEAAEQRADLEDAVFRWKERSAHDPYDSRVATRLIGALAAHGNRAAALQHARTHEALLRAEFDVAPPPEFYQFVEQLAASPAAEAPWASAESPVNVAAQQALTPQPEGPPGRRRFYRAALVGAGLAVLSAAVWLSVQQRASTSTQPPPSDTWSLAAHELYRRGSDHALMRTDSGVRVRMDLLRQAIALDSTYAAAWSALSVTYARHALSPAVQNRGFYYALADSAAAKAVQLDGSLAEAHAALATVRMAFFDFRAAENHMVRAATLDPAKALPHEKLVTLYLWLKRPEKALWHARRALELEPLSPTGHAELAHALLASGDCDEALRELAKLASMRPPLLRAAPIAAQCYARKQLWAQAAAALGPQAATGEPTTLALLAFVLARSGQSAKAMAIRDTLMKHWQRGEGGAYPIAVAYAGLREFDQAITWLDSAIVDRSLVGAPGNPVHMLIVGPLFEDLRARPRFSLLRPRLGLMEP